MNQLAWKVWPFFRVFFGLFSFCYGIFLFSLREVNLLAETPLFIALATAVLVLNEKVARTYEFWMDIPYKRLICTKGSIEHDLEIGLLYNELVILGISDREFVKEISLAFRQMAQKSTPVKIPFLPLMGTLMITIFGALYGYALGTISNQNEVIEFTVNCVGACFYTVCVLFQIRAIVYPMLSWKRDRLQKFSDLLCEIACELHFPGRMDTLGKTAAMARQKAKENQKMPPLKIKDFLRLFSS